MPDHDHDDWVDCPCCGGAGFLDGDCTCMEDMCCCLKPDPPTCDHCSGAGGWHLDGDD